MVCKAKITLTALGALAWMAAAMAAEAACTSCHSGYRSPMPPGKGGLACTACHKANPRATTLPKAHKGLVSNPSALNHAPRTCGRCHPSQVRRVLASPMATATGIINMTRFLWGAQSSPSPRYGLGSPPGLKPLPPPSPLGGVDDLLRRRCLRCHLWVRGAPATGARRSAGCSACHRPTDDSGRYIFGHRLVRNVPTSQCLRCHGDCGVGRQAVGFIPRDEHASARFLAPNPWKPELWQARAWRPMAPELHIAAGMECIDCHRGEDVMGTGQVKGYALGCVGVRCTHCHGSAGSSPEPGRYLHRENGKWILVTRRGRRLVVPRFRCGPQAAVAHRIAAHNTLACHACHGATNPAAWGLQVLLERKARYRMWLPIAAQGDPQVLSLITTQAARPPERRRPPATRDYLSGKLLPGMWLVAPLLRRHEWRVLVKGPDGRIFIANPRFQYIYCSAGEPAKALGWGLVPFNPHTTSAHGPRCTTCHGSALAAGLGLRFVAQATSSGRIILSEKLWRPEREGLGALPGLCEITTLEGERLQQLLVPGAGALPPRLLKRLLLPPPAWHRWHLKAMAQQWPWARPSPAR